MIEYASAFSNCAPLANDNATPDSGFQTQTGFSAVTPSGAANTTPAAAETTPAAVETTPNPTPEASALVAESVSLEGAPLPTVAGGGQNNLVLGLFIAVAALACAAVLLTRALIRLKRKQHKRIPARGTALKASGMEVGNAHHIGKRGNQEDSFAISDLTNDKLCRHAGVLAVVADGMGGLADGELVSGGVTSSVMREFPLLPESWTMPQKLLFLVEKANEAGNAVTGGVKSHGGSTMLLTLIQDGNLWFASVGDSRICLVRGGGVIQLTRPHTYESDLDKKAACQDITFEAASADAQRKALTSYIGMGELCAIDYSNQPIQMLAGDWVVLMTDGVFNELTNAEIAHALSDNAPSAAERIERMVLAKGDPHQDNLTAVVFRIF
jgi:serine/threonine protein phosphatase PrpC